MGWHKEIVDLSTEKIVQINSHELTAASLRTACADYLRAIDDYYSALRSVRAERDAGQLIIAELNRRHREGRKTVKIADLVAIANGGTE